MNPADRPRELLALAHEWQNRLCCTSYVNALKFIAVFYLNIAAKRITILFTEKEILAAKVFLEMQSSISPINSRLLRQILGVAETRGDGTSQRK